MRLLAFFLNRTTCVAIRWNCGYRPMVEFIHGGHRIWGATAAMLFNLLQRTDMELENHQITSGELAALPPDDVLIVAIAA